MRIGLVLLGTIGLAVAAESSGKFGTLKRSKAPVDSDDGAGKREGKAPAAGGDRIKSKPVNEPAAAVTDRRKSKPQIEQQLPKITSQPFPHDDADRKVEPKDSKHKVEAKPSLESAPKGNKLGTIKSPGGERKKRKPIADLEFEASGSGSSASKDSGHKIEAKTSFEIAPHKAEAKGGKLSTIKSPKENKRKAIVDLDFEAAGKEKGKKSIVTNASDLDKGASRKTSMVANASDLEKGADKGGTGRKKFIVADAEEKDKSVVRKKSSIPGIFGSTRKAFLEPSRSLAAIFEGTSGDDSVKMKTSQQLQTGTNEQSLSESEDDGSNDSTPLVEKKLRSAPIEKKAGAPQSSDAKDGGRPREVNVVKTKKASLKERKERCQSWDAHHNQKISTAMPVGEIPQTEPEKKRGYHSDGSESEAEQDPEKRKEMVKRAKHEATGKKRHVAPRKAVGGTRLEESDSAEYAITESEEDASHHLFKPGGTTEQEQRKPKRQHQYGQDHAEEYMWHPPGQAQMQSAPQLAQMNPFLMQQQLMQQQMMMMQSMGMGMPMPPMSGAAMPGLNPQQQPAFGAQPNFASAPRSVKRKAAPENPAIGPFGMASKLMMEGVEVMQQQGDGGGGGAGAEAETAPAFPQFNAPQQTTAMQPAMVPQMIPMMTPFGIIYMPATGIAALGPPHPDDEGDLPDPLDEHVVLNFIATTKKGKLIAKNMWRLFRMIGMAAVWVGVVLIIWFFGLENMILDIPTSNTTGR